ncbi:dTDP-3-amino-3,6-dideoxy-alpha-D-galactopyranose transaminase [compost metagenome]
MEEVQESLKKVFMKGDYILGSSVTELEQSVSKKLGVRHAISVNSGLDALILALKAFDIKAGDEVISVSNSFIATVSAIIHVGAVPVLVDVGNDRNIDPQLIEKSITSKTKAIIAVHLAGRPCHMKEINKIAEEHGIVVIEDAAQAIGATIGDRQVGSFGEIGCFSMHPLKNLGACGDGGIIVTDNDHVAETSRLLRNHGLKTRDECVTWGWNSRLDSIQAAILNVKMKYLDIWNERRREIALYYNDAFSELPFIKPIDHPNCQSVYHAYVIETDHRSELIDYMNQKEIECKIHYPIQIHQQKAFIDSFGSIHLPKTELQGEHILSIPVHQDLSDAEVETIAKSIKTFFK